ncbi:hypothetical protein Egran_06721 [Elaphomyces granulatus]|uniref:Uncharacterized protein n=1 Tax=Elaphomyces granulatus TaxID=519963 RepID=A0A232LMX9_9EURO|nr:hypothetical protein Egran_06721 [Elaphomyces granulatus]
MSSEGLQLQFIEIFRNGKPELLIMIHRCPHEASALRVEPQPAAHREGDKLGTPLVIKESREEEDLLLREAIAAEPKKNYAISKAEFKRKTTKAIPAAPGGTSGVRTGLDLYDPDNGFCRLLVRTLDFDGPSRRSLKSVELSLDPDITLWKLLNPAIHRQLIDFTYIYNGQDVVILCKRHGPLQQDACIPSVLTQTLQVPIPLSVEE